MWRPQSRSHHTTLAPPGKEATEEGVLSVPGTFLGRSERPQTLGTPPECLQVWLLVSGMGWREQEAVLFVWASNYVNAARRGLHSFYAPQTSNDYR